MTDQSHTKDAKGIEAGKEILEDLGLSLTDEEIHNTFLAYCKAEGVVMMSGGFEDWLRNELSINSLLSNSLNNQIKAKILEEVLTKYRTLVTQFEGDREDG